MADKNPDDRLALQCSTDAAAKSYTMKVLSPQEPPCLISSCGLGRVLKYPPELDESAGGLGSSSSSCVVCFKAVASLQMAD